MENEQQTLDGVVCAVTALRSLREEEPQCKVSLGFIVKACLRKKKLNKYVLSIHNDFKLYLQGNWKPTKHINRIFF